MRGADGLAPRTDRALTFSPPPSVNQQAATARHSLGRECQKRNARRHKCDRCPAHDAHHFLTSSSAMKHPTAG